jgi:DNA segregation ATPase FtsK/SpoIIIE, S-DNA-T family
VEDGRDFVIDLRADPHWLVAGATGSGKSGTAAAILAALAPTDVAVCLVDLKHGVSAEPYRPRASVIADTQPAAVQLLGELLELGRLRAFACRTHGVDSVYDLPDGSRPVEVVVLVDEVAELGFDGGDPEVKLLARQGMASLLRCVQLLRAFGIHVLIAGQRFGSALGSQITNIRAQLSGRLCLRVDDDETGAMVIGDVSRDAVHAALDPYALPGVAVVKGGSDRWQRVRIAHISHARLAQIATANSDRRVDWTQLLAHEVDGHYQADSDRTDGPGAHTDEADSKMISVKEAA